MRFLNCLCLLLLAMLTIWVASGCDGLTRFHGQNKESYEELKRMRAWLGNQHVSAVSVTTLHHIRDLDRRLEIALNDSQRLSMVSLRREVLETVSNLQGGDGTFALGTTHVLAKVFIDEPFLGQFGGTLDVSLARNESEGVQLVALSAGKELRNMSVRLEGRLSSISGSKEYIPESDVRINLVGYVDTSKGPRPYQSPKLGWWPDPLLPNEAFVLKADEVQPLLLTVTTSKKTAPGRYAGKVIVSVDGVDKVSMPLTVTVFGFTLPVKGHYAAFALGCSPEVVAGYYGSDPDGKIIEHFVKEALRHRMPPVGMLNGWGWRTPKVALKPDGSYDFSSLDRWLEIFKTGGVTRFPMVVVPRFRKFGGGDYTDEFKRDFKNFITAYAAHLKKKGLFEAAVMYNIDEASNDPKMREWEVCKELYSISKQAAPSLPVVQCLNEWKGVRALIGYADIWNLYFGQYERAGGGDRLKAGDQIMLSVCVWPSEPPNLFIEYPLLDARVMPWIAFRIGANGLEYWDMFATWEQNKGNTLWCKNNTRTTWNLSKNHGDGLLMYPGPDGRPLASLRLEALRDGIEDYEYLILLSERATSDSRAYKLLQEAKENIVTGITSYNRDPNKLLDLRRRIALYLEAS